MENNYCVYFYLREDKWQPVYCNYLKSDIKNILSHYQQNKLGVFS